ncbi:MAG TPA: arginine--tRNA ligase, partial [Propionibacteriaceae bacterium]|nr:arginine--tRNA ligase [Propionibacteriaceae bacterium]
MPSLPSIISQRIADVAGVDPELRPATKPQFGHFQSNVALRLAKSEGRPPRQVAQSIVERVDLGDLCEPLEIAGPGFINIRLRSAVLARAASELLADGDAGIAQAEHPRTVVIDYSAPNVAKQMHVGHLRTTIIGDCFNRVLRAQGHVVIAQNHIGDWGTQFGMLVEQVLVEGLDVTTLDLPAAEALYKRANAHFQADPEFADAARLRVVALQSGDEQTRAIWWQLIDVSMAGFNQTYDRLHVLLTDEDIAGESSYNDDLAVIARDLEERGIAVIDDGALVVWVEGFDAPLIVRKRDGGFGYACTDLAAIRRRVSEIHADRIIYVTDARQAGHFAQMFAVARKAGYLPERVEVRHVGYGMVLGNDGRPFKTRDGSAATLTDLLDAAEHEASPEIALAAIKYADLSNGIQKDYVFDAERMVQTTGDTGPYLQYAHARITQILRRAEAEQIGFGGVTVLDEPAEQELALLLTRFGETVAEVSETLQPHRLCGYLFDLATAYSSFYEQCPVLRSEGEVRASRLALCAVTRTVLARG